MPTEPCGVYQPRQPRLTPFFQVVEDHWEDFIHVYDDRFEKEYGRWRPHVADVLERYLACGDLHHGFGRVRCDDCGCEYLLAFSCKTTCFCPSCHQKRALLFAEWVDTEVLKPVVHRQYTFTIPRVLRGLFQREPDLLGVLCSAAWTALRAFFVAAFEKDDRVRSPMAVAVPGAIVAIQTYGDQAANYHPHIHMLVTEGVFAPDGRFHDLPIGVDLDKLTDLFRHEVFRGLLDARRIRQTTVEQMLKWNHSGFHVHRGNELEPEDSDGRRRVARYLLHPPVAVERMEYDASQGVVTYRNREGKTYTLQALEWLARVASHIPNKRAQLLRYFGAYSNKTRGLSKKQEEQPPVHCSPEESRTPGSVRKSWARLLAAIWQVDPLICPRCHGRMRIMAFLHDPFVIKKILRHLGL